MWQRQRGLEVSTMAGRKLNCAGWQEERLEKDAEAPEAGCRVSRHPSHPLTHSFIHSLTHPPLPTTRRPFPGDGELMVDKLSSFLMLA